MAKAARLALNADGLSGMGVATGQLIFAGPVWNQPTVWSFRNRTTGEMQ
jgi:hypothetical protein